MRELRNKTSQPLRIPLPGGKSVFVGPGKVAQIADNAVEHTSVKKLLEEGSIEILGSTTGHASEKGSAKSRAHTKSTSKTFLRGHGDR